MSSPDQRCGTCKWWSGIAYRDGSRDCEAPIPHSVDIEHQNNMPANYGTTCPCWEAKE